MSDAPAFLTSSLPATQEPYRVAVRRFRWFHAALLDQLRALSGSTGLSYDVDARRLAAAFVAWLRHVEAQRPRDPADRRAFFDFAAGAMLRELLAKQPIRAQPAQGTVASGRPEHNWPEHNWPEHDWPEGFACTVFCINMRAAVLAQEYAAATAVTPDFFDRRTWDSFQENVREQASTAIGFLELFVGGEPNWIMPDIFRHRAPEAQARLGARTAGTDALS